MDNFSLDKIISEVTPFASGIKDTAGQIKTALVIYVILFLALVVMQAITLFMVIKKR